MKSRALPGFAWVDAEDRLRNGKPPRRSPQSAPRVSRPPDVPIADKPPDYTPQRGDEIALVHDGGSVKMCELERLYSELGDGQVALFRAGQTLHINLKRGRLTGKATPWRIHGQHLGALRLHAQEVREGRKKPAVCTSILSSSGSVERGQACGRPGKHLVDGVWFCGLHEPERLKRRIARALRGGVPE